MNADIRSVTQKMRYYYADPNLDCATNRAVVRALDELLRKMDQAAATTTREDAPDAGGGDADREWLLAYAATEMSQPDAIRVHRARAATARPADTAVASAAPEPALTAAERRVVEAARNLKHGAYPAHGSGYVAIITEGGAEFQCAVTALEALAPPASAPAADAEGGA